MEERKCEIFENGTWREIAFKLLIKGDKFRLYEPTGEMVADDYENTEFVTTSDAYMRDGTWQVDI